MSIDEKWKELSIEERQEKEQFLRSEEHVSKSFMEMVGLQAVVKSTVYALHCNAVKATVHALH